MPRKQRFSGTIFAQVVDAYMDSPKYQGLAPHTKLTYRRYLLLAACLDGLGSTPVEQMRPALVQAFLDGFSDRLAAQQKAKVAIAAVERWAIVRDLLPRPITMGTEAPGSDGGHVPWSSEQVSHAEMNAAAHLSRAVTMAANTGQRGSDLAKMRWTDLEIVDGHPGINVIQRKTGLHIWIPFTQDLIAKMATWERRPGFILTKRDGHPFTGTQLRDAWRRELRRPEMAPLVGLVLHGLRGTAVVRLRRAGATTQQICDMVGMSPQMVKRYSRKSDQKENALAAVLHLEGAKERRRVK
jgi:integrase